MRILIHVLSFILIISITSFAQNNLNEERFQKVDNHVSEVNKQFIFHPKLLSQKLTEGLTNDYDKVRAFYVWIARNIDYDLLAYINKTRGGQSINQVMRSGKALCAGFSLLFEYFCNEAKIESVIIEGYAKGYGYSKKQKFVEVNHSWNAVKIYDRWYLLDVTWATGDPTHLAKHQKKLDLYSYFLTDPKIFIKTHLPEDPSWQLLSHKISIDEFESDQYDNKTDWPFNSYAPNDYVNMDEYEINLEKLKRAKEFNPNNPSNDPLLAFAYLYKGISITDNLWKMDYDQLMNSASYLEDTFYIYMDSAAKVIDIIDFIKVPYREENMKDEINYQKGVFNYELGVELYSKSVALKMLNSSVNAATSKYFKKAEHHFKLTSSTSIYAMDAKEYLSNIAEFRNRAINWKVEY